MAAVTANSPAAKAGVKQGDVILSFNGTPVKELRDLPRAVAATAPDSDAPLTVWRGGKTTELRASLGEAPENPRVASAAGDRDQPDDERADALGLHLSPLTSDLRRQLNIGRDVQGVVITGIDGNSPPDIRGLSRGDVLVSINQEPVRSPEEAANKLREVAKIAAEDRPIAAQPARRHAICRRQARQGRRVVNLPSPAKAGVQGDRQSGCPGFPPSRE